MERKLLVSGLGISYEGLFDAADFFKLVDDWFKQNGYEKNEKKHTERVSDKGKTIYLETMPIKNINEYIRYEVDIKIRINDLTETTIKRKDEKIKINKGKIDMEIDAFLATDVRNRMESKPLQFFLRTLFDKFVHREYISSVEKGLLKDVQHFHTEMKSYLNLERYKEQA